MSLVTLMFTSDQHMVPAISLMTNLSAVFAFPVINYCSFGNHSCQHECVSVLNGYFCRCNEGYTLQEDGKTCLRKFASG